MFTTLLAAFLGLFSHQKVADKPVTTCQWPNTCAEVAQVETCVWPHRCANNG